MRHVKTAAEYREEHALAIEIADYNAPCSLEANLVPVTIDQDTWYDLDSLGPYERVELAGVIRYCELRGLLRRNTERPNLIQTLEP